MPPQQPQQTALARREVHLVGEAQDHFLGSGMLVWDEYEPRETAVLHLEGERVELRDVNDLEIERKYRVPPEPSEEDFFMPDGEPLRCTVIKNGLFGVGIECHFEHGNDLRTTITFMERTRIRTADAREEIQWLKTRLRNPRVSMFNTRDKIRRRILKLEDRILKERLIREAGPYSAFGPVSRDVRHMICDYAGLPVAERQPRR